MTSQTRQTVTVNGRTLHLRRLGSGAPVVLLHESPRSSAVLLALAQRLAADFTVFALDSPGYGSSDPLPLDRPTAEDFADAIVESLRGLGLRRFCVYGTHTGAVIAIAMAKRHPGAIASAVLDGYPVFTVVESDVSAYHYLPTFEPSWEGTHVARLWSRVRDQYTFFPWNMPGRDSRLARDPPAPELQAAVIRDILAAANYVAGYEAAFRADGAAALAGVTVPVTIMCREDDLLFAHLDRLPSLPANFTIDRLGADREVLAAHVRRRFHEAGSEATAPAPRFGPAMSADGTLAALAPGVLARCYGTPSASALPLVLLHDLPGSAREWHALARREASRRPVIAIECPSAGLSAGLATGEGVENVVATLLDAIAAHGMTRFDVGGRGMGALLGLALARQAGEAVRSMLVIDPPGQSATAVRDDGALTPDWHGGHMMAAWYEARDRLLYKPWNDHRAAAARSIGPGVDIKAVQRCFTAILLAQGDDARLARALLATMPACFALLPDGCKVVLQSDDPDLATLRATFGQRKADVAVAHYDDLTDAAARMLRA